MKLIHKVSAFLFTGLIALPAYGQSGSMRIEVEVYNGPLSKTLDVQKAELKGVVDVTSETLALLIREFHLSQCRLGCFGEDLDTKHTDRAAVNYCAMIKFPYVSSEVAGGNTPESLAKKRRSEHTSWENSLEDALKTQINKTGLDVKDVFGTSIVDQYPQMFPVKSYKKWLFWGDKNYSLPVSVEDEPRQVCPVLSDIKTAMIDLYAGIKKDLLPPSSSGSKIVDSDYLDSAARYGATLTEGAEQWASAQMAILPESTRMKIAVARASISGVELGTELNARADAIKRQEQGEHGREILATSLYLRNSEGSDYLNLVEWMNARPRVEQKWSATDRTRMVERLIADANWSKVNEAFAQGRGKVNMVFAKDDIGNWNLKSYDNDPSELLNSYFKLGTTLVSTASKLATGGVSGTDILNNLSGIQQANSAANDILLGTSGDPTLTHKSVDALEARTTGRLQKVSTDLDAFVAILSQKKQAQIAERTREQTELTMLEARYSEAQANENTDQQHYDRLLATYEQQEAVLNNHKANCTDVTKCSIQRQSIIQQVDQARSDRDEAMTSLYESKLATKEAEVRYQRQKKQVEEIEEDIKNIERQIEHAPVTALKLIDEIMDSHAEALENLQVAVVDSSSRE